MKPSFIYDNTAELNKDMGFIQRVIEHINEEEAVTKANSSNGKSIKDILLDGAVIFLVGAIGYMAKEGIRGTLFAQKEAKIKRENIRTLFFYVTMLKAYLSSNNNSNLSKLFSEASWRETLNQIYENSSHDVSLMAPEERLDFVRRICDRQNEILIKLEETTDGDQTFETVLFRELQDAKKRVMPEVFGEQTEPSPEN